YRERAHPRPLHDGQAPFDLIIGTAKFPVGKLKVVAHVPTAAPSTITISEEPSGEWYVSFCCELPSMQPKDTEAQPHILRTQEELMYELGLRDDLDAITVGMDRGVAIPVADSAGRAFDIHPVCRKRIDKNEGRIALFQRRLARQTPGSRAYRATKKKLAKLKAYGANVRRDFAHKTSRAVVRSDAKLLVFEDLKLQNMTRAPKPKVNSKGRYVANGAAAKAGSNKSMLSSALGLVKQFAAYKAAAANKLVLSVPAHHTSQECSVCHKIDHLSRVSQSVFRCTACGHTENADMNASKVIKHRGILAIKAHMQALSDGAYKPKKRKVVRVRRAAKRSTVGQVVSEPAAGILQPTLAKSMSDAANDPFVQSATLADARNPHLALRAGGG
ncbi:MAG: transposase, partial [Betaproteobacteria bacterium]|nr:transposase [Betaproteobacteria bacterium]